MRPWPGAAHPPSADEPSFRVGLFTDTLDDINGVWRFLSDMAHQAQAQGCDLTIHTCSSRPRIQLPGRRNFQPLLSRPLPLYPEMELNLPPLARILAHARQQAFHAIHVSTPGPMGLCGWLASRSLGVPLLATYHTDLPAYVRNLSGSRAFASLVQQAMRWFYRRAHRVLVRSQPYCAVLQRLGIAPQRLALIPPAIDTARFNPAHADPQLWRQLNIPQPHRLLYVGRLSLEKNLPLLAEVFGQLCRQRNDLALILAGDGPYRPALQAQLSRLPAYFLGYQDDAMLGKLYASADLLLFPSRTDTLGQAVMEAQASGLPALVSTEGGPGQIVEHGITGLLLPPTDASTWCRAVAHLLQEPAQRSHMGRAAAQRIAQLSLAQTFHAFWHHHRHAAALPAPTSSHLAPYPEPEPLAPWKA